MKFHQLKKANGFPSDNCTLQYLLNYNEKRCLQLSTDNHDAAPPPLNPLSLGILVMRSRTPAISTRYDILHYVFNVDLLASS